MLKESFLPDAPIYNFVISSVILLATCNIHVQKTVLLDASVIIFVVFFFRTIISLADIHNTEQSPFNGHLSTTATSAKYPLTLLTSQRAVSLHMYLIYP